MERRILMAFVRGRILSALAGALWLAGCQPVVRPNLPAAPATPPATSAEAVTAPAAATAAPVPADPVAAIEALAPVAPVPTMGRGADVFERINKGLSPDACSAGSNSHRWRKRYAGNPAAFSRHLAQVLPLLDFVSMEVERSGLPSEFVFIPLVESWYKPEAMGAGGPAGMWQMISSTARNHGVHIQPGYDGRLSPVESTRAALSYLKTLQGMFGNWQAIVMAYNAGEGRIQNAFRSARSREVSAALRKPHGLSNITYDYVAKLQALSCLVSEPERNGLSLPSATQFVPVLPLLIEADVQSLDDFARQQNQDPKQIRRLNPGFKNGRVVAGVPRLVLTPTIAWQAPVQDEATNFDSETRHPGQPGSDPEGAMSPADPGTAAAGKPTEHEVRSGDSLWSIARRYGVTIDALRRFNKLGVRTAVHPGQKLKLAP
ncbi:MAG: transglycosylase SLT domain-containing protein [Gammaproteobacteria bacterium]|nr:transglycosylase SLT domain-containing protein [Gammaproteobacteria bacterium]